MMKRFLIIVSFMLASAFTAAAQVDSLRFAKLDSLLTQFYAALERESVQTANNEFDSLIQSCRDSLLRQHVTLNIFDHYRFSRVMGQESIAIHVYDKWIKSGLVKTRSEFEQMEAEVFAEFNRSTQLGMKAPVVELLKPRKGKKAIPEEGKVSVLFFYDTQCAKCKLEARFLPSSFGEVNFPMNFYAVYSGENKKEWKAFRKNFSIENKLVNVVHLWDPEMESNYQKLYGVTATPRMYLVLEDGEIVGRRLEVINLQELIHYLSIAHGQETQ